MLVPADSETPKAENPAIRPAQKEENFARTEERLARVTEGLAHVKEELASTNKGIHCVNEGLAYVTKEFATRKEELASVEEDMARMNEDIARGRRMLECILRAHLLPDLVHCVRLFSHHFAVEYEKQPRDLATTPSVAEVAEQARKDPASLVGVAFAAFTDSPDFEHFKDEAMINLVKTVDRVCIGKTYSNSRLLEWLVEDGPLCARVFKSRWPGHDGAIDTLLAVISALRTSVMSSKPPWRYDDDETSPWSDGP
jgi:hypothetical protein